MFKSTSRLIVFALSALVIQISFGQSPGKIGIYRVALDEPAGPKNQAFAKPIVLKLRQASRAPAGFHARLFRGSVEDLKRYMPDSQGCVRYDSVVLPVRVRGEVQMQGLDDPAWLRPAGDGFQPEQYTIVFETGDQPSDSVIRIHEGELNSYFQYAFSINLIPPQFLKQAVQETVSKAETVLQVRREEFQRITASVCWSVQATLTPSMPSREPAAKTVKMADLIPCVPETPQPSDGAGTLIAVQIAP